MEELGAKEQKIMDFLHERIFDPILASPHASETLKQRVRFTIMRLEERDAAGMIRRAMVGWGTWIRTRINGFRVPQCTECAKISIRVR